MVEVPADNVPIQQPSVQTTAPVSESTMNAIAAAVNFCLEQLVPPGSIAAYGGTSDPTGWNICDGRAVSRTDPVYVKLFAKIGTAFGAGDGVNTFNIPLGNGLALRGVDNGVGNDPDSNSRIASLPGGNTGDNVGSLQLDQVREHFHPFFFQSGSAPTINSNYLSFSGAGALTTNFTADSSASNSVQPNVGGAGANVSVPEAGGAETRMINLYVNFIVKL